MAWTQAQVDALKAAIASGVRAVAYGDRTVTYQSLEDMLAALGAMEAEVAAASPSDGRFSRAAYRRE